MTLSNSELREVLLRLIDALMRKDTERDGNWGYKNFYAELNELKDTLKDKEGL